MDFSSGGINASLDEGNFQSNSFIEQQPPQYMPGEYQGQPSLWMSLFNAFKNLFNMNTQAEITYGSPKDNIRNQMNLRNSFHRSGFDGTPVHGIVGRSSLL